MPPLRDAMEADLHVLGDGQVLEQLHELIGAHEAARGNLVAAAGR